MSPILELIEPSFPWMGLDPFIFTVHHLDRYPAGNPELGPQAPLAGRRIGSDFSYLDGWSMYHGSRVPGFPQHPHRGFETVTVVRQGFVDHSDSLGATARYGQGDTQWLTTAAGIMHAEMFPLLDPTGPNTLELFQIWLNLPPQSKMVPAHFRMLWSEEIPALAFPGATVDVIAGTLDGQKAPPPPPNSWASEPGSEVAIWLIQLEAGASWLLPPAPPEVNRMLHFYSGSEAVVASTPVSAGTGIRLQPDSAVTITSEEPTELVLLQGRPIGAPVFQMGPFVMNSPEEIQQALIDYRLTGFGGWPWSRPDPVHDRSMGRFAVHADGRVEHRDLAAIER